MYKGSRRLINNLPAAAALSGLIALTTSLVFLFKGYSKEGYKTVSSSSLEYRQSTHKKQDRQAVLEWYDAIKIVSTPRGAQKYLESNFTYDADKATRKTGGSFKNTYKKGKGLCFDYATTAAALLADDGYRPLILRLDGKKESHAVYLYRDRETAKFGALGNTPRAPEYECIRDLAMSFGETFENFTIIDLDSSFPDREWVWGDIDLSGKRVPDWEQIKNQN